MTGPRVLLIQHERATPPGLVSEWLESHRADVDVVRIDEGERYDPVDAYDMIVSLGSEFSAGDDTIPWIGEELEVLRAATAADVPLLGICFGGQLLARSLGAEVFKAAESEIGWFAVDSDDTSLVPAGPWFQWHFDTFSAPDDAQLVALSHVGPQAFVHGRSLGVQFHPEVNMEIMERWVETYMHELEENEIDPAGLLERTREVAESSRRSSWNLFEGFYERVARLDPEPVR